MAKRKAQQDPFSYVAQQQDHESDEAKRPPEQKNITLRIGRDTIDRFNELAERWNVQKSDLGKYLMDYALDAAARGDLARPTTVDPGPRKIQF